MTICSWGTRSAKRTRAPRISRSGLAVFEDEVGGGEVLKVSPEERILQVFAETSVPQIAVTNADEERFSVEAIQIRGEVGEARRQIADYSDHDVG